MTQLFLFARFVFVGGLNTLVGFALYALFVFVGLPALTSLALATVIGVVFNYYSYLKLHFTASTSPRMTMFLLVYAMIFLVNAVLLMIGKTVLGHVLIGNHDPRLISILAQVFSLVFVVPFSYLSLKRFVYQ